MSDPSFVRIDEAAELLNVHPLTVRRAINAGKIQAYRVGIGRGTIRLNREDVLGLMKPVIPTGRR